MEAAETGRVLRMEIDFRVPMFVFFFWGGVWGGVKQKREMRHAMIVRLGLGFFGSRNGVFSSQQSFFPGFGFSVPG